MRAWALTVLVFLAGDSTWADLTESPQRMADIGNLKLVSGEILQDAEVGYRTAGKLDAKRSNVLLVPTWFGGNSADCKPSAPMGQL
jgi:homoserine O-acetyltransferase